MEKKHLPGIEEWTDAPNSLPDSLKVMVGVRLSEPPLEEVIAFPDLKDRVAFRRNFYHQQVELISQRLADKTDEQLPDAVESQGFSCETTLGELCARLDESIKEQVWIKELEGHSPKPQPAQISYYCLKLLFQVQYEGLRPWLQEYDVQMVMIQADSSEEALEKLQGYYIPASETPYLNEDLRLVRWKFVEVLDENQISLYKPWEELVAEGVEVFSRFQRKRMQESDHWDGRIDPKP